MFFLIEKYFEETASEVKQEAVETVQAVEEKAADAVHAVQGKIFYEVNFLAG